MPIVFLALGSNLGDRHHYIQRALSELEVRSIKVIKISKIIETDPVDSPPQGQYLNCVVKVSTTHSPEDLLELTQSVEHRLGRVRTIFHGPRVIDIDILLYDDLKIINRSLVIPHPRMLERDFVMKPLKEIAPDICASLLR